MNKVGTGFSDANFLGMLRLPLQGSGALRNLHEAMSLGTPQSLALKTTVQAFNNATTRGAQYCLIDKLSLQTRLKPHLNMTPSPFGHSPYYAGGDWPPLCNRGGAERCEAEGSKAA